MPTPAAVEERAPMTARALRPVSGASARSVTSLEEVESLRPAWSALQGTSLPADLDYFVTLARHHREVLRPNVVVVERDGSVVALVAAYLQQGWVVHRLGPWNPYTPTLRTLTTAYRGFLGERSPEVLAAALGELRRLLDRREAEAIHLRYVCPGDEVDVAARALVPARRREHNVPVRSHWGASLGGSLEETLASRSSTTRESLRRTVRKLERTWAGRHRLVVYRDAGDGDRLFDDVDLIASRSYQRHGGELFGDRELERSLARVGLERGWFRAYVLYLDDRPAAYWTGYAYGGLFGWRGATGYDPQFRTSSPGTYVLVRMLEDLSADPAITMFDLGGGDVEYKRRLADTSWEEVDVRLFGPGARNLGVNVVGSSVQLVHRGLRAAARVVGAHDAPTKLHRNVLKQRSVRDLPRS